MARVRKNQASPYTKTITVSLRPAVWKKLRLTAVRQDRTIQALVDELLSTGLGINDPACAEEPVSAAS